MDKEYYVYILASKRYGTLYVGVTSDLMRRVWEHRNNVVPGFTKDYQVKMLVWYEAYGDIGDAILREKRIKKWNRVWKTQMISKFNPLWRDLYLDLLP